MLHNSRCIVLDFDIYTGADGLLELPERPGDLGWGGLVIIHFRIAVISETREADA